MKLRILILLAFIVIAGWLPVAALAQEVPEPDTTQLFGFSDPAGDYYDPINQTTFNSTDILAVRGYYTKWYDVMGQTDRESLTFSIKLADDPRPGDQYVIYIDTDGNSSTGFSVFFSMNQSGYDQLIVYSEDYVFCCFNATQYCETDRIFYEDLWGNDLGQVRYSSYIREVVIEVDVQGFDPKKANYFFETDVNMLNCDTNETHRYSDGTGIYLTPPGQEEQTPFPGLPAAALAILMAVFCVLWRRAR